MSWFQSYLSNRQQVVKINSTLSSPRIVSKDVPQGSVLGPLLFMLFTNDLSLNLTSSKCLFADDVTVYSTGKSLPEIENKLQLDLDSVRQWCWDNCMPSVGTKHRQC